MISESSKKIAVMTLVVILATLVIWLVYNGHKKRELRNTVIELVRDSGARLKEALQAEAGTQATKTPGPAGRLDGDFKAVEQHLAQLRGMNADSIGVLAGVADDYLLSCREILLRVAASHRYRMLFSESSQALREHMGADNGTASWIGQAIRGKERVEQDYHDYKLAIEALDKLLESLPDTQTRVAPYAGPGQLIEPSMIDNARKQMLGKLKQATGEIENIRQLVPRR